MIKKVRDYVKTHELIKDGDLVLAGVSGGADSVCLLLLLSELRREIAFSLAAVHVEHGIRGAESAADAEFVRGLCRELGLECDLYPVDAVSYAKEHGMGLEEAARILRYRAFGEAVKTFTRANVADDGSSGNSNGGSRSDESSGSNDGSSSDGSSGSDGGGNGSSDRDGNKSRGSISVALAHHMEDQAETVLFQMSRGSGIAGLGGMQPVRMEGEVRIIRPLLCVRRAEIEAYLREHGQDYRTDATNASLEYSRNRIRRQILPVLNGINENAVPHIARTAEYLSGVRDYLGQQVLAEEGKIWSRTDDGSVRVLIPPLLAAHPLLAGEIVRYAVFLTAKSRKDLTSSHIEACLNLTQGQSGRRCVLPYGVEVTREFDELVFLCRTEAERMPGGNCAEPKAECLSDGSLTESEAGGNCPAEDAAKGIDEVSGMGEVCVTAELLKSLSEESRSTGHGEPARTCETEIALPKGSLTLSIEPFGGKEEEITKKRYTKCLDYDMIKDGFVIRSRKPGDYLILDAMGHRKLLKEYLIEQKIPRSLRDHVLLVARGSEIVWVIGGRIGENYKVTGATDRIARFVYRGGTEDGTQGFCVSDGGADQ